LVARYGDDGAGTTAPSRVETKIHCVELMGPDQLMAQDFNR